MYENFLRSFERPVAISLWSIDLGSGINERPFGSILRSALDREYVDRLTMLLQLGVCLILTFCLYMALSCLFSFCLFSRCGLFLCFPFRFLFLLCILLCPHPLCYRGFCGGRGFLLSSCRGGGGGGGGRGSVS